MPRPANSSDKLSIEMASESEFIVTTNVVFIDSRVADYQSLIDGLPVGVDWYLLNAEDDGIVQMAELIKGRTAIDSIQIISHGSSGTLYLGNTVLNSDNLNEYRNPLATIGGALTQTGDILLYGCNVAQGDFGQSFVNSLAQYTQADVAASDDPTGSLLLGGDLYFEVRFGDVSTNALIAQTDFDKLRLLLALPPNSIAPGTGTLVSTDAYGLSETNYVLYSADEILYYRFIANDTGRFDFLVSDGFGSYAHNAKFRIYDSSGIAITGVIDNDIMGAESISLTLTGGFEYYIAVSGDRASIDSYHQVSFHGPAPLLNSDPNDQISEAFLLEDLTHDTTPHDIASGTINPENDVDMWSFYVTAGQRLVFDVDIPSGNLDSYLRLFNSSGTELGFNDDGPAPNEVASREAWLEHTFASTGMYYIGVSAYGNSTYSPLTGTGDEMGTMGLYDLYVSVVESPVTASEIFESEGGNVESAGMIRVMADFSKAAYALQSWEVVGGNRKINDDSPNAEGARSEILSQRWAPLNLTPTPALSASSVIDGQTVTNSVAMSNGYYSNGNAAAFVARCGDAVVISFRGTNDNGDTNLSDSGNSIHPDKSDWRYMRDHYELFAPLINALDQYVSDNGIDQVYVTGHSLGGAMAIRYMGTHSVGSHGNTTYSAVTFAAPGFVDFGPLGGAYYPDRTRVTHIEINGDVTPDTGAHGGRTIHFVGSDDSWGISSSENHSMDYYRQIAQSVDAAIWTAADEDRAGRTVATQGHGSVPIWDSHERLQLYEL